MLTDQIKTVALLFQIYLNRLKRKSYTNLLFIVVHHFINKRTVRKQLLLLNSVTSGHWEQKGGMKNPQYIEPSIPCQH